MLSNILREKNFNVCQLSPQYITKPMAMLLAYFKVKAMLLAQCKYVKEFLITDYSKAFCNAILGK
jgi:hypothetical protein